MLSIKNLQFRFDEPILNGVNLQIAPGEIVFVLGPSGCGKSTMLRCIAGLLADGGAVKWNEEKLGAPQQRSIGMMFQEPSLFPHMNVWQNVSFGFKYRGMPKPQWRAAAIEWLDLVGISEKADAKVDELSGGQKQRVALARCLAARPRAVLLDEPLSALDRELRDQLGETIADLLRAQQVAAIWVTHDEEEAQRLATRTLRMAGGKLQPL